MTTYEKIIKYILYTPTNTNRAVLSSMLDRLLEEYGVPGRDYEYIIKYALHTPLNTNRAILEDLIDRLIGGTPQPPTPPDPPQPPEPPHEMDGGGVSHDGIDTIVYEGAGVEPEPDMIIYDGGRP